MPTPMPPRPGASASGALRADEGAWPRAGVGRLDGGDAAELSAAADAADRQLMHLVVCAAAATLMLALANSLGA